MTTEAVVRPKRRQRRKTLTDLQVAGLPRKNAPYFHPDPELGRFGIRVRPSGPGAYTVIMRDIFGKQRWVKVGSTDAMAIKDARAKARDVIARIEQGLEPFAPPKIEPESVQAVCTEWLARHVKKKKLRSSYELERIVTKYILPFFGKRNFVDIGRKAITDLLNHVEDEHGARQAHAVYTTMRSIAGFYAIGHDDYRSPLVAGMGRYSTKDNARERVLTDDEIKKVWRAADDAGAFGSFVRLALLTAQRREKLMSMKWSDISPDSVWTISTEKDEKGNGGALRLPALALAVLKTVPRFASNPYVFAGRGTGHASFNSRYDSVLREASGTDGWIFHDLRRSARTLLAKAKVPDEIAERVLGHAIGGVKGTYNRFAYPDEKADALLRLASLIESIVHPPDTTNVVPLREAVAVS
jgi:integrase